MAKPKVNPPEQTQETLLDRVAIAREELVTIERTLERLKDDIATTQKRNSSGKKATRQQNRRLLLRTRPALTRASPTSRTGCFGRCSDPPATVAEGVRQN
jgi:hypothetical protein